jgi:sulfide:quinone oxidoreductase
MSHDGRLRVLIAGGGVAALEAMLALRALAEERVDVELLAPEEEFSYLPLAVAEPFGDAHVERFELPGLAEAAGARFRLGALTGVDPDQHRAQTSDGARLEYEALLIACGARPQEGLPGALTFRGPEDVAAFAGVLEDLVSGAARSIVFALPGGLAWTLPLYELALLTAAYLARLDVHGVEIGIVSHEDAPLALFGHPASEAVRGLLDSRGIAFHERSYPALVERGKLVLVPDGTLRADRVVALPRLTGPALAGVPHDGEDFIPTDPSGRVDELVDVYAAGDATAFPVKQGGIATQQADAAAETIAARAGAPITPVPFRPVLRGLLLTGAAPGFLRAEIGGGHGPPDFGSEALWWPPSKVAGHYLAPFLASHMGLTVPAAPPVGVGALPIDVDLG